MFKGGTTDEINVNEALGDAIKLWYIWLENIEDKSLQILMRHGLGTNRNIFYN